jgi:hypothetical protein
VVHQEADGVTTFATPEALVNFLCGRYGEGWGFFVVKRTLPDVVYTTFFQSYKPADDLHDVYPRLYLLYGLLTDQLIDFDRKDRKMILAASKGKYILEHYNL